jgi:Tol biopolymer transport system component
LEQVWKNSFVEEGNLNFTISLLRKTLQDNSQNPRFIKTVPLSGYKFIAPVKNLSFDDELLLSEKKSSEISNSLKNKSNYSTLSVFSVSAILIVVFFVAGFWYARNNRISRDLPILNSPFAAEKLTTDGNTFYAVISPDGKNALYSSGKLGKQSIWVRELETNKNIEIVPTFDGNYLGLVFSPDGNFFYFARNSNLPDDKPGIFRASIFGGNPTKIIEETMGGIDISRDGTKISFVRCPKLKEENCSLWIADSLDGKNEQKIVSRPIPFRISNPRFSPDGKSIAFAAGQSENQSNEFGLMSVNLENGEQSEITSEKFFNIKSLVWLPDDKGWLVTASKIPNRNFLIWRISKEQGKTEPLTKDSESYATLSLDKSYQTIVSTQVKSDFKLLLFDLENPARKQIVTESDSASFSPDGKIVFSSEKSGNKEIWAIESNGGRQIQLTNNSFAR